MLGEGGGRLTSRRKREGAAGAATVAPRSIGGNASITAAPLRPVALRPGEGDLLGSRRTGKGAARAANMATRPPVAPRSTGLTSKSSLSPTPRQRGGIDATPVCECGESSVPHVCGGGPFPSTVAKSRASALRRACELERDLAPRLAEASAWHASPCEGSCSAGDVTLNSKLPSQRPAPESSSESSREGGAVLPTSELLCRDRSAVALVTSPVHDAPMPTLATGAPSRLLELDGAS